MTRYRVFGTAVVRIHDIDCTCFTCLILEHDETIEEIVMDIEADSIDDAIEAAEIDIIGFIRWQDKPQAIPYAAHERPPLAPDIEREWLRRWVEGTGLPGERVG